MGKNQKNGEDRECAHYGSGSPWAKSPKGLLSISTTTQLTTGKTKIPLPGITDPAGLIVMKIPAGNYRCMSHGTRTVLVAAIALLFLFALCQPAAASRDVRVALTELRPTLFTDEQGKPAGFFVDLINDIAAKEGWNVIWVHGSLSESWGRLASGEIDLLPGVATTPDRENLYDFSHESALSVWSQVYARHDSGINTILDLDGKRIATVKGALSGIAFQDYARKFGINVTFIEKNTPEEVFSATASGETDALVVYNTAAQADAVTYGLSATPVMFNPTQFGFAVQKGKNKDLLTAIDQYVAKGKNDPSSPYSQAMQRWFGIKSGGVIPPYIWWILATAAGLIALFVIMSLILRREVRRKTAELSCRNEELQSEVASRTRAERELIRKNEELLAAYGQLIATEEELRENYHELGKIEQALRQARKKLSVLTTLTAQDLQNSIFSLSGYIELAKKAGCSETATAHLGKSETILHSIDATLRFSKNYQDLGISQPQWQNVSNVFLYAVSHLDLSRISRTMNLDGLEIYADPLLEKVFSSLMANVIRYATGATTISLTYQENPGNITILITDNGPGIPAADKEKIFERAYAGRSESGLFLAREILSITGITIRETGTEGSGARFEIQVPEGAYRFPKKDPA
jgi:ABC-type amino acid transport substrate-binding protein